MISSVIIPLHLVFCVMLCIIRTTPYVNVQLPACGVCILLTQTQLGSVTVNWGPLSLMGSVAVTWGPSPSFGVRHRKLGSVMVDGKNVREYYNDYECKMTYSVLHNIAVTPLCVRLFQARRTVCSDYARCTHRNVC